MRRLLERRGYIVVEAENGAEALERYRRGRIDALVTDMVMPGGMNGRELAAALREIQPDLAVVFLTGHRDDVTPDHDVPGEAPVVLTKPVAASELVAAIETALARRVGA
jgi:CheY-like chemotaxis protein